jgi:retinal rod rhodopsin-sensitive cGMP 3',5'-cyclic phosphodiesterase subunit delta
MTLRNAENGRVLWESADWASAFNKEVAVSLPKEVLACKVVSRETVFWSRDALRKFRLVQNVKLHGQTIEVWNFEFGFVIPGSTNSWQCVIAAGEEVLPAEVLSGNVTIETDFFDGDTVVASSRIRVNYV